MSVLYAMLELPRGKKRILKGWEGNWFDLPSQAAIVRFGTGEMDWQTPDLDCVRQLAFAILCDALDNPDIAYAINNDFVDLLTSFGGNSLIVLTKDEIERWTLSRFGYIMQGFLRQAQLGIKRRDNHESN